MINARFAHVNLIARDWRKLAGGGSAVGTVESIVVPGAGRITWTNLRDPEGTIIELQGRDPE